MSRAAIPALLAAKAPAFSFEFFPPKDDAAEAVLWDAVRRLEPLAPAFVSVTYGAGGSTRDRTVRVTERIAHQTTLRPMAHLTCVSSSVDELREVIGAYAAGGVRDILALRGDPPGGPGAPWTAHPEGLDHAEDLVRLVRSLGDFTVGVAAFPDKHPEASSLEVDADVLVRKFAAGAEFAVTQFVFDATAYARLRDLVAARGHNEPIVPGLMPVTSFKQVARMAELSGTPLPAAVVDRLAPLEGDPTALRAEGVAITTELAQALLAEGAPGLHFYTMNRSTATLQVHRNLVGQLPTPEAGVPASALAGDASAAGLGAAQPAVPGPGAGSFAGGSTRGSTQGSTQGSVGDAVATVQRFLAAVDAGDWAQAAAALGPDVEVQLPVSGTRLAGREAAVARLAEQRGRLRVERMVHDGARQVVVWLTTQDETGPVHDTAFFTLDPVGPIESVVVLRARGT
ncbi:MAG: methylenetetrahydrofolate reductase [NAD(P)H] [Austwickia sp.]|jgi:methylenetetrahydrofolate reductase (NADPH)|nr:MAG: methylenetetrahydrofolate reductase [NAD(P)H] [Austwickia sp.]